MLIGVTNTVGSAIARLTHCGVHINAGCEIGVASTKAYTSQMVAITMMALMLSEDSIARRAKRDAVIEDMGRLPDAVREVHTLCAFPLQMHSIGTPCHVLCSAKQLDCEDARSAS